MIVLIPIKEENLSEEDVVWLVEIAETGYHDRSAEDIVRDAMKGLNQLWRIGGAGTGLLVSSIRPVQQGKAFWIEGISGKDLIPNKEEFIIAVKDLARNLDCTVIIALLWNRELMHEALKLGADRVGVAFALEV